MRFNQVYNICPLCNQGELIVVQDLTVKDYLIMCDDCFRTWSDPDSCNDTRNCLPDRDSRVRDATPEEIRELGWLRFLKGE